MKRFALLAVLVSLIAAPAVAQTETPVPEPFFPCAELVPEPESTPAPPGCAHLTVTLSPAIEGGLADWYIDGLLAGTQLPGLELSVGPGQSHKIEAKNITDPTANGVYQWLMSYPAYAYLQPGAQKTVSLYLYKKFIKGFLKIKCVVTGLQPTDVVSCLPSVDGQPDQPVAPGVTSTITLLPGKHAVTVRLSPDTWYSAPASKSVYIYAGSSYPLTTTFPLLRNVPADAVSGLVTYVVDGDTIDVMINGVKSRVRYIGINTPEMSQTCGSTAKYANSALVYYKTVALGKDVSETDQFGRLLRYVWVGDTFVNAELVRKGYAQAADYPPDTKFSELFHSLEAEAKTANIGCWPTGVWNPPAPPPQPTAPVSQPPSSGGAVCDCSGNIYNCGDFNTHSQAQACYNYCISVGAGDIHQLDGDNDGSACESLP